MEHNLKIDDNAFQILNRIKEEMRKKGINKPSYNDAIRYMDVKTWHSYTEKSIYMHIKSIL